MGILERTTSRRKFLTTSALAVGAATLGLGAICDPALMRKIQQDKTATPPRHFAWAWQFASDGSPGTIASALAGHAMAVTVKTHDATDWMSKYDSHASAINGPGQVATIAQFFESAGVPFHAWCVVRGIDPLREAQMAAEVLAAGARSLTLDLEGSAGFWVGTPDDAIRFGDELRRLSPFGRVDVSIDPRPWRINLVPMAEFVIYTDAIWPQLYWDTFNSPGNFQGYAASGYPTSAMTPEFLLDTTQQLLAGYGRPVIPVGQGAAVDPATWPRFQRRAWELGMGVTSVWRYGVTRAETLAFLGSYPAGSEPPVVPVPTPDISPTPEPSSTNTPRPTRTPTPTQTSLPGTPTPSATASVEATATETATPGP